MLLCGVDARIPETCPRNRGRAVLTVNDSHSPDLLITKLTAPVYRGGLVARARLTDRMQEGTQRKLTLVLAPAGFGKTTLLREWAATIQELDWQVAWVLLDEDDNGPGIWSYILGAIKTIEPALDLDWREVVDTDSGTVNHRRLGALINRVAAIPHSFSLILDDYHEIRNVAVHRSLTYLIEHLPHNMRLIISSRCTPPIPLARLRSQQQVAEVSSSDLSFTREETEELLREVMGLSLTDEDISTLVEKTEGWIAGLQMAVLSLKSGRTASSILRDFSGDNSQVFNYLTEEVMSQQTDEVRRFLIRTSLLDRMTAGLCDRVAGTHDSQTTLEHLEQAHLFVIPLDERRRWYRYHSLFAGYLKSRLELEDPEEIARMHEAACSWLESHGHVDEAIPHALAFGDYERAAADIERAVEKSILHSDLPVVLRWTDRLPEDAIRKRPRLALSMIMARVAVAKRSELQKVMVEVGDALNQAGVPCRATPDALSSLRDASIVRITAACIHGDYERAMGLYQELPPSMGGSNYLLEGMLSYHMHLAFFADGRFDDAVRILRDGLSICRDHGLHEEYVSATSAIARLHRYRGWLHESIAVYEDALHYANKHAVNLRIISLVEAGLSDVYLERGQLEMADRSIQSAKKRFSHAPVGYLEWNFAPDHLLVLVRNCLAHRDFEAAREFLDEAEFAVVKLYRIPFLVAQTKSLRVRYLLDSGNVSRVADWVKEMRTFVIEPGERVSTIGRLSLARAALSLGQAQQALDCLPPATSAASSFPLFEPRIELNVLRALALRQEAQRAAAEVSLLAALRLAEPEGYMHVFAAEGPALRPLLSNILSDLQQGAIKDVPASMMGYVQALWKYCSGAWEGLTRKDDAGAPARTPSHEALSARELEVLRLLASGMGTQQISETLFVSVHTTRTHVKKVYQKLGVHTRDEAIQRAILEGIV